MHTTIPAHVPLPPPYTPSDATNQLPPHSGDGIVTTNQNTGTIMTGNMNNTQSLPATTLWHMQTDSWNFIVQIYRYINLFLCIWPFQLLFRLIDITCAYDLSSQSQNNWFLLYIHNQMPLYIYFVLRWNCLSAKFSNKLQNMHLVQCFKKCVFLKLNSLLGILFEKIVRKYVL